MTISAQLLANARIKYGSWYEPYPEISSFAALLPFRQQAKIGEKYRVAFLSGYEHGQTASRQGGLFPLNPAIGAETGYAELDGSTIMLRTQYAWDDVYASMNEMSSFKDAMSLKMKAKVTGANLYRDLALAYGPGAGAALSSNIGVVKTTVAGAISTSPTVFLTKASFIRGLWPNMRNALVDIYQSDGTTLRSSNVQVIAVPVSNKTSVTFGPSTVVGKATSAPAAIITVNDVIVPAGWKSNSCIGWEAICNTQTGTLFGANVVTNMHLRTNVMSASGAAITAAKIREWSALVADRGCTEGGTLKVSGSAYAAAAAEYQLVNRDTSKGGMKLQGETGLQYDTPCGRVKLEVWDLAKQGQGIFIANQADAYRVGSTDLTMEPIKGLNEAFLTNLTEVAGCQSQIYSNQAPFCENGWLNYIVPDVVSPGDLADA